MGGSGWTHAFHRCAGRSAACPAGSVWLHILGAPLLAGTPEAARPAGFGLLGAFKTLECVAGVKAQAVLGRWGGVAALGQPAWGLSCLACWAFN